MFTPRTASIILDCAFKGASRLLVRLFIVQLFSDWVLTPRRFTLVDNQDLNNMPSSLDILGALSSVIGLGGTVISIWQFVNPHRLLRSLDDGIQSCEQLLVYEREEGLIPHKLDLFLSKRLFL
jgi:hypothetical protein